MAEQLVFRVITDDEVPQFRAAMMLGFGADYTADGDDRFRRLIDLDRTIAAFDGDQLVGTLGDFDVKVTVPGGAQLAMAGTTMVTVRSTHRRRGILRSMIDQHLAGAVGRGEPLAGLWASQAPIYGRFGYGVATENHQVTIDHRLLSVDSPEGTDLRLDLIDASKVAAAVGPLWSALAVRRSGFLGRTTKEWGVVLEDPEASREGASARRHVTVRRGSDVVGYLAYRQREKWDGEISEGSIAIEVLVSADVDAHRALWTYVTSIDLFPNVSYWNAAVDEPIVFDVSDPRYFRRQLMDALYVRVLDITVALTERSYEADGAITMGIVDHAGYCSGSYSLTVSNGVPKVTASDAAPAVTLDVRELGSLYLGGMSAVRMARAGLIDGTPDAVALLDRLFRTAEPPWCPYMF